MVSPAEQRRAWAYALISRAATPPPAYGSVEWLALPDGPERVAAVILAAEKFALDWEAQKAAEDAAFADRRSLHKTSWTGREFRPDPAIASDVDREWREWVGGAA
jgi:hypothetical protein